MAQFTVNAQRFDPYKNFKFRVKWDGKYVAGVSKVGSSSAQRKSSNIARAEILAAAANHRAAPSMRRSRSSGV